jgi:phosphatidate cytidylyltransferase
LRVASAAVLAPLALACLWLGGLVWTVLMVAAGIGLLWEWNLICRRAARTRPALRWLGVIYVGPATASLLWLRADPSAGGANVLFVLLIVWGSDIGAYVVGRLIGGPKLAPSISPGKTRSGAVGGLLAALAVGLLAAVLLDPDSVAPLPALAVAAVLGVVSQAGDLLESAIKRYFGVKDSGHLIPGHGGLLDRLDGVLTAAPAAALLALFLGRGVFLWG